MCPVIVSASRRERNGAAVLSVKDTKKTKHRLYLRRASAKIKIPDDTLKAKTNDLTLFNPDIKGKKLTTIFKPMSGLLLEKLDGLVYAFWSQVSV